VLSLVVAAIVVPALIFSAVALQRNNQAQQAMLITLAEAMAASIAETLDYHLDGMVTTLRVFSTSLAIGPDELETLHRHASVALNGTDVYLVGADENLNQLFNTRAPFEAPLGTVTQAETARQALTSGEPAVTGAFFGRIAQKWVFNVMLPIPQGTGPVRLMFLSQEVDGLANALSSQNLRGGWNAVIVDREGIVLASSFMSSDIGKPFFLDSHTQPASSTVRTTVKVGDETYETIRSYSEASGWQAIVWAPTSVVHATIQRTLRLLALGGLAIIAVGGVLALLLGRQVARSVRRLARDARRLGAGEDVQAVDYAVSEIATVSQALAQASRDRQAAENEIRFLMREVAHRSKNQLTVVSSIAKQTARHSRTFAGFQDAFQKRVHGLARSTDLLIAGGVAGVELRELVDAQIEPFAPSDRSRIELSGPYFRLSNQAAQTLGLALHEMATNAAKYGAFATSQGRLAVVWSLDAQSLHFTWRETVPRLRRRSPGTRGFGTEVIERMLGGALGAAITRDFHRDGLECRFVMSLDNLQPTLAETDEEPVG